MNVVKLRKWAFAGPLVAAPALFGCSAETLDTMEAVETRNQSLLPAECDELGENIHSHTCEHGAYGPFGSVSASSNASFSTSTPKFSGIHRYFTVTLPGSSSPYTGTVKFTPANNDSHAVYFHPSVTVTVKDKNGNTVTPELSGTLSTCTSYLTGYSVFDLKKSTSTHAPYWLTFSSTTKSIKVSLEEVTPMAETWYVDEDGDGFGRWPYAGSSEFLQTACIPWGDFENGATASGDCNDSNASVYPGSGC